MRAYGLFDRVAHGFSPAYPVYGPARQLALALDPSLVTLDARLAAAYDAAMAEPAGDRRPRPFQRMTCESLKVRHRAKCDLPRCRFG